MADATDPAVNPPAVLEWHRLDEGCYVTNHEGQPWMLWAHSVHRGKSGWSGTNEWHLHEGDENTAQGSEGRWLCPAGRGTQFHKTKLVRAQKLAAWIIPNRERADRMTMDVIKNVVLDGRP